MTPEREAYLAKCSKREKILRAFIANSKEEIGILKWDLKSGQRYSRDTNLLLIRHEKIQLNAYRHELARLKGMDKVVVPAKSYSREVEDGILVEYEIQTCPNCNVLVGGDLCETHKYCPNCGRRILWERLWYDAPRLRKVEE